MLTSWVVNESGISTDVHVVREHWRNTSTMLNSTLSMNLVLPLMVMLLSLNKKTPAPCKSAKLSMKAVLSQMFTVLPNCKKTPPPSLVELPNESGVSTDVYIVFVPYIDSSAYSSWVSNESGVPSNVWIAIGSNRDSSTMSTWSWYCSTSNWNWVIMKVL